MSKVNILIDISEDLNNLHKVQMFDFAEVIVDDGEVELMDKEDFNYMLEQSYKLIYNILESNKYTFKDVVSLVVSKRILNEIKGYDIKRCERFFNMFNEFKNR